MTDHVRELLENEFENTGGDVSATDLLGKVAGSLPDDTKFGKAKSIAEEVVNGEAVTDGGASADDSVEAESEPPAPPEPVVDEPDVPTPADGEAHPSGDTEHTAELRSRDWWVNWVLAYPTDDNGDPDTDAKATKQPVAPYDNGHARPVQWNSGLSDEEHPSTSFLEVVDWDGMELGKDLEDVERVISDGIGIGIIIPVGGGGGRPITLLDWDDVRDPETGEIHPVCAEALDRLDGFAEISQSGEGIHQFVFGEIPGGFSKFLRHIDDEPFVGDDLPMIEMYSSGRLTAMTGNHVAGCGDDVVEGQELIDDLCWQFGTWDNNSEGTPTDPFGRREGGVDKDDYDTPDHDEVGQALRDVVEYDGDDPNDWDIPDDEPVEYHAVLRARQREPEMVDTAHWELLGYAAALACHNDISKEQLLADLEAHPRQGYEFDEAKARKEIRGVWRKAESGSYEAPGAKTLARRGILPKDYAAPDYPVYDVVESAGIELHLIPITGKLVNVAIVQNDTRAYTEEQERGFWTNGTKRGRIAGRVADVITGAEPDAIRTGVKSALNQASVDAHEDEDEWDEAMRSGREQDLRDRTVKVVCYPAADEAEWVVTMHPSEDSSVREPQQITFDQGDFNDANAGTFRNKHLATFYKKIDVDSEEWFDLVEYWLDIQETKEREPDHEEDAAVEKFLSWVQTMQVWADEEGYDPNGRNGYYWPEYDNGTDAICVPGQKVVEWKKREDFGDVSLSRALKERGIALTSSKREYIDGYQHSVWPINAEKTSHTAESAHEVVDENDDDKKPEGLR